MKASCETFIVHDFILIESESDAERVRAFVCAEGQQYARIRKLNDTLSNKEYAMNISKVADRCGFLLRSR